VESAAGNVRGAKTVDWENGMTLGKFGKVKKKKEELGERMKR